MVPTAKILRALNPLTYVYRRRWKRAVKYKAIIVNWSDGVYVFTAITHRSPAEELDNLRITLMKLGFKFD
jgi:hypothetical protein